MGWDEDLHTCIHILPFFLLCLQGLGCGCGWDGVGTGRVVYVHRYVGQGKGIAFLSQRVGKPTYPIPSHPFRFIVLLFKLSFASTTETFPVNVLPASYFDVHLEMQVPGLFSLSLVGCWPPWSVVRSLVRSAG